MGGKLEQIIYNLDANCDKLKARRDRIGFFHGKGWEDFWA